MKHRTTLTATRRRSPRPLSRLLRPWVSSGASLTLALTLCTDALSQCSGGNLLSDPQFYPCATLGNYTNNNMLNQWLQEDAVIESSAIGCVIPLTPNPEGMLHMSSTGGVVSQVRQVVELPAGAGSGNAYAIAMGRFNSPTSGSVGGLSLWDGNTLVGIPGASTTQTLDSDCGTWEDIFVCTPIPAGTQRLNLDLYFTNSSIPQGGFVEEAGLWICLDGNLLTDPQFAPGTPLGSYTNNSLMNQWLEESAVIASGPVGCVTPLTPNPAGMIHLSSTGGVVSQVRQVVALPGAVGPGGACAIVKAKFNSPTAGSVGGLSLWDGLTLVGIPGASVSHALDSDCNTWEDVFLCAEIPPGTTHLNLDLRFTNTSIPQGGFIDEAFLSVCSKGDLGLVYCGPGAINSTGDSGVLMAVGSEVTVDNNLTLGVSGLPANQFGYFLNSTTQAFIPMPGGSQGNLCLGGAIGRYNASIFNGGSCGRADVQVDLTQTPTPSGPVSIAAGETWNFQCWYRDLNPLATSNFTNAVSVTFQ